jgi:bifunctional non-homologous end joining protein LigD
MHVREPRRVEALAKRIPVVFMAFDLLYLDGKDLTDEPLRQRREALEEILVPDDHVQLSPLVEGAGEALYRAAEERGLEGIVAKRLDSRYETGARSRAWLKVKLTFDADVVIVGWTEGEGRRRGRIGSLVMAVYDSEGIRYVGNVGTGFDRAALEDAARRLEAIETSDPPFDRSVIRSSPELRRAHWVEPRLVAVVEHRQLTDAGRLRAPSFKGWRDDKAPQECTFDQLQPAPPRGEP